MRYRLLMSVAIFLVVVYAFLLWTWPYVAFYLLVKGTGYRLEGPYIPPNIYARGIRMQVVVDVTAYNCVRAQTDSTPNITASGMRCGHPVLAVSQDLLRSVPFGTKVAVDGQRFVVGDTMHRRWIRRIDIPMASRGAALRFGVRKTVMEVHR